MPSTRDDNGDGKADYPRFGNLFYFPSDPNRTGGSPTFGRPKRHRGVISRNGWGASFQQITDGTSHTFAVGECIGAWSMLQNFAAESFATTAHPINSGNADMLAGGENYWPNPANPRFGSSAVFRSLHPGGAMFCLADGSVTFIQDNIDQFTYMAYASSTGPELKEL
jgi:prepilin-type processing-associated H-X9-DG protein